MPGPQARVTLDGPTPPVCTIKGPGVPTVIVCGGPASVIGDSVVGPVPTPPGPFTGVTVPMGPPSTVIIQGRPATRVGDMANGIVQVPSPAGPVPTPVMLPIVTFPTPICTVIVG